MLPMRHAILILIASAALALASCAPPEPIHIGFLGGLSGRVTDLGIGGRNGAKLAIELRNKAGGVKGRTVDLIEADDQQDTAAALKAFDRLVEHKVAAVIGPMTSAVAMAIVPRANQEKLLLMSPTVSTTELVGIDDYLFRVIPTTHEFVQTIADHYSQVPGLRRIRLVYDLRNRSYTESWVQSFSKKFSRSGGSLLEPVSFTSGDETRFQELAQQALSGKPQAIIIIGNSVDTAMLCQAIRKQDTKIILGATEWAATEHFAELGGKWVEGITVAQFIDRDSRQASYLDFRTAFQNRFGRDPGYPEALSFDATNVVLDALEKQGPNQTLKEAILAQKTFSGVQWPITFDVSGDMLGKTFMVSIQNGRFVMIKH